MKLHQLFVSSILTATCVFLSACSQTPASVAENFYGAIEAGNVAKVKEYMAPQVLALVTDDKLSKGIATNSDKMKKCGGIAKVDSDLKEEGDVAFGTTTITYKGKCPPQTEKGKLIKVDGKWKITASK